MLVEDMLMIQMVLLRLQRKKIVLTIVNLNLNPIRKDNFFTQYYPGSISKIFDYVESEVVSFIITVDYNAIHKF